MAPGAFAPGAVVIRAPRIDSVALTPRTLEGTIFPSEGMDLRLALFGIEEVVHMGEYRHG
jgi:hypothetical protein